MEDEVGIEELKVEDKKKIVRVPNRYNIYFKIKSNFLFRKFRVYKLFTFLELYLKWTKSVYFDNEKGLYIAARKILKKTDFDYVIASGEPFILFKYAIMLKKEFKSKVALDYRDGWTTNELSNSTDSFLQKKRLKYQKKAESKIINQADLLIFASETLKNEVKECFSSQLKNVKKGVVNNGVKFFEFSDQKNKFLKKNKFYISFIGTLYKEHNVSLFLNAFEDLILKYNCSDIVIVFVGSMLNCPAEHFNRIKKFADLYENNIYFIDYVDNKNAVKIQLESSLLLKFNAFEQKKGHFGKKLYEYAFSGKKVLAIDRCKGFVNELDFFDDRPFIYNFNSKDQIIDSIKVFYKKWQNKEPLSNEISKDELDPFTTKQQTIFLEQLLNL